MIVWAIFLPIDLPAFIIITLFKGIKQAWKSFKWYQLIIGNIGLVLFCMGRIIIKKGCTLDFSSLAELYMPVSSRLFDYIMYKLVGQYED